jgi:SAM-dependent methyltransferase
MIKSINNQANLLVGSYFKLSIWGRILFISVFLLIVVSIFKRSNDGREGFQQSSQFVEKSGTEMYDDFYADIYDYLVYNNVKDDFEIGEIINKTSPTEQSIVLDIGSGTGHHVDELASKNIKAIGVDISPNMVQKAKQNYPKSEFQVGDIMDPNLFESAKFTHVLCLYFTIYYFKDKQLFFQNCMNFLKPGGYLVIHLVNRNKFDPILPPGNPLIAISPQRYAKERITNTKIKFDDFEYEADFKLDTNDNSASFVEKFKNDNNDRVRKHEHKFYMETQEAILSQARDAGFILDSKIDLIKVSYEYQYLYVLTKPN